MSESVRQLSDAQRLKEPGSRVLREHREQMQLQRAVKRAGGVLPMFRAFAGGGVDRLTQSWTPVNTHINVDLEAQLPLLRARSRSLWANTSFGRRFATLVHNNVVGPAGFTLQSSYLTGSGDLDDRVNNAIEAAYARWCRAEHCDITQRMSFPVMCGLIVKMIARDGEALVRKVRGRDAGPFGYALQVLDPDRVDHLYNAVLPNGNAVRMGVEIATTGRIVAYHILQAHPGDSRDTLSNRRERVLASDCWLLYPIERAEQLRGIPWAHAVLIDTKNAAGFEEAAIIAARAGASKFAWIKQTDDSSQEFKGDIESPDGEPQIDFSPASVGRLPYGYDLGTFDPNYPSDVFDSFVKAIAHKLAAGLNVAHHNLSGRMDGVNYSSARIAEMSERENWRVIQAWLIDCWLLPMAREWLAYALLFGQVTSERGTPLDATKLAVYQDALGYDPRGWDWVDPKNEVDSNNSAVEGVLDSRTSIARRQGRDFNKILAEQKRERRLMAEAGIPPRDRTKSGGKTEPEPEPETQGANTGKSPAPKEPA